MDTITKLRPRRERPKAMKLSDAELDAAGVGPGTVRLSVGTETVDDLIWDLEQAFARLR